MDGHGIVAGAAALTPAAPRHSRAACGRRGGQGAGELAQTDLFASINAVGSDRRRSGPRIEVPGGLTYLQALRAPSALDPERRRSRRHRPLLRTKLGAWLHD